MYFPLALVDAETTHSTFVGGVTTPWILSPRYHFSAKHCILYIYVPGNVARIITFANVIFFYLPNQIIYPHFALY